MRRVDILEEPLENTLLGLFPSDKKKAMYYYKKYNTNMSARVREFLKRDIKKFEKMEKKEGE